MHLAILKGWSGRWNVGGLKSNDDTEKWLLSVLKNSLETLELPLLIRLYQAVKANDYEAFLYWSHYLSVNRETLELRDEEHQRARAIKTLLQKLDVNNENDLLHEWSVALEKSQIAVLALAAVRWDISLQDLIHGYAWSWLENSVSAAIKLVPLGQSQGQQLLFSMSEDIVQSCIDCHQVNDDAIGASTPALAIASSLHETQYSRLFRS